MPRVGIRKLKNETSEIIRAVREDKVEYVITHRGKAVAIIRPVELPPQGVDEILAAAAEVYAGLSEEEVAEVEELMVRSTDFFGDYIAGDPKAA